MKQQPKWTIGFVAYGSSTYIEWQLKGWYQYNDPLNFRIIIVDNTSPNDRVNLEKVTKACQEKYGNIQIVYYSPKNISASGQHGEGINQILPLLETKYFIIQDPDFFWVRKGILDYLESEYLKDSNLRTIGAPYPLYVGNGAKDFPRPCAWC